MKTTREGNAFTDTHRACTKCGDLFERVGKDTMRICKVCNSERVKSGTVEYKMCARAKGRCVKSGLEFSLTPADIVVPEVCPIMGIPLVMHKGVSGGHKDSPSLDRIDSSRGYTPDNVWVISHLANQMKSHATEEELRTFSQFWIKKIGTE